MKKLSLILCILWMGFIFYNSSQTGIDSNNKSFAIINKITDDNKVENTSDSKLNDTDTTIVNNENRLFEKLNIIVRKSAHAIEFFILTILVMWVMYSFGVKGKDIIIYTLFIILLYAVSDEFHQLYVEGRTGRVEDVIIDFIGGVFGVGVYIIFNFIFRKVKSRRKYYIIRKI